MEKNKQTNLITDYPRFFTAGKLNEPHIANTLSNVISQTMTANIIVHEAVKTHSKMVKKD